MVYFFEELAVGCNIALCASASSGCTSFDFWHENGASVLGI